MIKKFFILSILGLTSCLSAQAQTPFHKELAVGASFGMNFSSVTFMPKVQQGMLMGFNGGLTIRWNTEANLGLQAEINYSQQGWEEDFSDNPEAGGLKYSRTINYVELPFLTHIYFGSKRVKVFFNLGPKIGYAISESTDENLNGEKPNKTNDQHGMAVEQKFDWGLCGGPGLELRTGIGYFLLEGRYYYALGDIFHSQKKDFFSKSAGQVISVKLTYLLPIGK